jgi:hypothetical protein
MTHSLSRAFVHETAISALCLVSGGVALIPLAAEWIERFWPAYLASALFVIAFVLSCLSLLNWRKARLPTSQITVVAFVSGFLSLFAVGALALQAFLIYAFTSHFPLP